MNQPSNRPDPDPERPSARQIQEELFRIETKNEIGKSVFGAVRTLVVIAATAVLIANLLIAVLSVSRSSMSPMLEDGDVVVAVRLGGVKPGDIVAFHYNNKILVKRIIAQENDWVSIDEDGNVYVNSEPLSEPYLTEKNLGDCDIEFPFQVPDSCVFVMGDQRVTSSDSRQSEIGAIKTELIVGKIYVRVWPLPKIKLF